MICRNECHRDPCKLLDVINDDVVIFRRVHTNNVVNGLTCPRYNIDLSSKIASKVVTRFIEYYENHDPTDIQPEFILSKTFSEDENDIIDAFLSSVMKGYIESGQTSDLPSIMNPMTEIEYTDSIKRPVRDQRNKPAKSIVTQSRIIFEDDNDATMTTPRY